MRGSQQEQVEDQGGRQRTRAEAEEAGPGAMKAYFCSVLFHFHFLTFLFGMCLSVYNSVLA